ncbi:hypothetical protein AOLI_G00054170 [Acnodon oligacanthus]
MREGADVYWESHQGTKSPDRASTELMSSFTLFFSHSLLLFSHSKKCLSSPSVTTNEELDRILEEADLLGQSLGAEGHGAGRTGWDNRKDGEGVATPSAINLWGSPVFQGTLGIQKLEALIPSIQARHLYRLQGSDDGLVCSVMTEMKI